MVTGMPSLVPISEGRWRLISVLWIVVLCYTQEMSMSAAVRSSHTVSCGLPLFVNGLSPAKEGDAARFHGQSKPRCANARIRDLITLGSEGTMLDRREWQIPRLL